MSSGPKIRLVPPRTKPLSSSAFVPDGWYVVARSRDLKKPFGFTLMGTPMAIFRDGEGKVGAVLDRCPHRNVPLSTGCVENGELQCPYHGWRFDREGRCTTVPGLAGETDAPARRVPRFAALEQQGFIWVWGRMGGEPSCEPPYFKLMDDPTYSTIIDVLDANGTLHAVAENALDVPHTAFLHKGLFRGVSEPNKIDVVVQRWHDRVEAEYIGEPRPTGLVGRVLAPDGGLVQHFDRFLLPCTAQVEYRIGKKSHVFVNAMLTPISDFYTRLFAVVSFKLPLPHWLIKLVGKPIGRRVFNQDAVVLKEQTELIHRFGGEQFASTELDVLGQHIRRLLRAAERGDNAPMDTPDERRFTILV